MTSNSTSLPQLDASEPITGLWAELKRILEALDSRALSLRLTGSMAVQMRCPRFGHLARRNRVFHDIDFAAYKREARPVQEFLVALGYVEDREVAVVSEGSRSIFQHGAGPIHIDIFYDKLDFCHVIPLEGRLQADAPTLPLAELLLSKLQIVKINEKDLVDAIVLLLEHGIGEADQSGINIAAIARLCGQDWGLWRTVTINLDKIGRLASLYGELDTAQKALLDSRLKQISARLEAEDKPLAWRLRSRLGDRVKWYKDVEDID